VVGTNLVRKSNPSSFLVQVKQNSSAFCRDPAQGLVKLCAAIATRRPKNIASETLRVHTLEDVPPISDLAAHQGDVRLLVDLILECVKTELAVFRRQTRGCASSLASMLTQNAVSNRELFCKTISGISSASKRSSVIAKFAIFIVNNDHHLPRSHGRNSILDTRKHPCTLDGLFDYAKAPAHMGDVSERVPA